MEQSLDPTLTTSNFEPAIIVFMAQEQRIAAAARRFELDVSLAPYPLGHLRAWQALSHHITPAVLQRLTPVRRGASPLSPAASPTPPSARRMGCCRPAVVHACRPIRRRQNTQALP